jgi:hypothetical protein
MEIKFRGLAFSQGWVYGSYIHSKRFAGCSNEHRIFNQETGLESDVIGETVGQFTGLTDKNGKEAYLGDKIQSELFGKGIVVWDNYELAFKVKWDSPCQAAIAHLKYSEIIGNIHENYENNN